MSLLAYSINIDQLKTDSSSTEQVQALTDLMRRRSVHRRRGKQREM